MKNSCWLVSLARASPRLTEPEKYFRPFRPNFHRRPLRLGRKFSRIHVTLLTSASNFDEKRENFGQNRKARIGRTIQGGDNDEERRRQRRRRCRARPNCILCFFLSFLEDGSARPPELSREVYRRARTPTHTHARTPVHARPVKPVPVSTKPRRKPLRRQWHRKPLWKRISCCCASIMRKAPSRF